MSWDYLMYKIIIPQNDVRANPLLYDKKFVEICKDMVNSERAYGFFEVYKMAGYTKQQVIKGVKAIDNWFSQSKGRSWDQLTTENFSVVSGERGPRAYELRYDPKFVEICEDIGFDPKSQYQLMQLVVQLKPEILKYAEKNNTIIIIISNFLLIHP